MSKRVEHYIGGKKYTKTSFASAWSELVNSTECNFFLKGDQEWFVKDALSRSEKFRNLAERDGVRYKIRLKKFQGRKVRGVVLITPNSKREVWIGKEKLVNELFPSQVKMSEPKLNRNIALQALRQIIEPQIKTFRQSARKILNSEVGFSERCPLSGELLRNCADNTHIDHIYPFSRLVEDFCRAYGLDLETLEVYTRGTKAFLKNTEIAESWFDYHMMKAKLQLCCGKANIAKSNKYYGE